MFRVWMFGGMLSGSIAAVAGCSFTPGEFMIRDAPGGGSSDAMVSIDAQPIDAAPIPIVFHQEAIATNAGSHSFVTTPFPQPLTAGSTIVAVISWTGTSQQVFGVADNSLNPYSSATALAQAQGRSQRIYFASNVQAGGTAVSVALTGNVSDPTLRVFEYSGLATSPVDNTSSASASTNVAQAGPVLARQDNELLFAATTTATTASGPGSDYTARQTTPGRFVEDRIIDTQGSYSATVPLTASGGWIMQLVAFKGIP